MDHQSMCRKGCGACCIALSISSSLPGMPDGKPAGVRCINLGTDHTCSIHGMPEYPSVCRDLRPSKEMCGDERDHALAYLESLERITRPE